MEETRNQILQRKTASFNNLRTKRLLWDSVEQLFHNQLSSQITNDTKSQVFDPKLTTLVLERGYRVMSQFPTGKVKGISKNDVGASQLMNLVLDKYIIPNANAQFDFLTKLRMTDIYSNVYGTFFALVDWSVRPDGYVGPDMWLLNVRDVFPQVGAVSIEDSDYIIVRTWKPLSFFEGLKGNKEYKNIDKIVKLLKDKGGSKQSRDSDSKGKREEDQYPDEVSARDSGFFEVLTQYEREEWTDYCVDADMEFRSQKNPHENGELPVVAKYSIPLLDDFMGMGDFERGKPMQMVTNSIWNLYLDAVKMSIYPPIMVNKDNIASFSSITQTPAAKWLVRNQINNAIQVPNLNPQGIATFNNTYQVANSSLLNQFGSTDTSVTAQTEAGFGKTPEALKAQQSRENTRDNSDRFYMEQFLKEVMVKMVNLVSKKQPKAISIRMFGEEIEEIKRVYPEIEEVYNEKTGKVNIDKGKTGSILYDYEIVSGSTFAVDQGEQQKNLVLLMQMIKEDPNLVPTLQQEGYNIKMGELFKRIISNSGIQDWDKILEEQTETEKDDTVFDQGKQQLEQAILAATGGMNGVPPQPSAQQPQGPPAQPVK